MSKGMEELWEDEEGNSSPDTNKIGVGLREQINEKTYAYNKKFSLKELEEILIELSKGWKEKKRVRREFLEVYQEEGRLGFQLKNNNHFNFYTGIGGFIQYYNINPEECRNTPVKLNGIELNDEQTEVFWKQFNIMREYYERTK